MQKIDWLLLSINNINQPVKIQKTLFKFAMESGAPKEELYTFVPYLWGPVCIGIYDDLGVLCESEQVESISTGRGWSEYRLTTSGVEKKNMLRSKADPKLLETLDTVRIYVAIRDFHTLLSDIYQQYPQYATESVFRKE